MIMYSLQYFHKKKCGYVKKDFFFFLDNQLTVNQLKVIDDHDLNILIPDQYLAERIELKLH